MAAALNDRIAAALNDSSTIKAANVALLREETGAALAKARHDEAAAESAALDPALTEEEANSRREEAIRLGFLTRRLAAALSRLEDLESYCGSREAEDERIAVYDMAVKARDAAANMIRAKYPAVQETLMALLREIAVANDAVARANGDLPKGASYLDSAEGVAFGYPDSPGGRVVGYAPPSLSEMLIPNINNWADPAWPPGWHGGVEGRVQRTVAAQWLKGIGKGKGRK